MDDVSRSELTKILGLTPRRVRQLVQDGVIPAAVDGRFELATAVQGYCSFLRQNPGQVHHETALAQAKAEMAQLQLDQARGQLIDRGEVELRWLRMVTNARNKILALVSRAPPAIRATDFSHRAIAAAMRELVHELLNELTEYDGKRSIKSDGLGAAAGSKRGRVGRPKSAAQSGGKRRTGAMAD